VLILFVATALAASSVESAVYAWADKCPSTAMRAGVYGGTEYAAVTVDGRTVYRLRSQEPKGAHPSLEQSTLWMLSEGCRAVGLVRLGGADEAPSGGVAGGGPPAPKSGLSYVGFVVAKEGGVPTEAEQAMLLAWAGRREADPKDPARAAAAAALLAPAPVREDTAYGALLRRGPRVWREGAIPTQVEAWKPDGGVLPVGAVCPCWTVFTPGAPGSTVQGPYVARHYGGVGTVTLLEDPTGRWAVETERPFFVAGDGRRRPAVDYDGDGRKAADANVSDLAGAPPAALAGLESGWWMGGDRLSVALRDPETGASFVLTAPVPEGASNPQALWSADGVALPGVTVPTATLRAWLAAAP
jgi:hypothetical protein